MRRISIFLLLILVGVLVVGVAACGSSEPAAAQTPATGSSAGNAPAPDQILGSTLKAGQTLKSSSGSFDLSLKLDVDTSKLPDQEKSLLTNPITLTGTFAGADSPQAVQADVTLGLAGQTMKLALKDSGDKSWVQLNNQWYETPPELQQTAQDSASQAQAGDMMKLITDLGVDPATWLTGATVVGQETLDNVVTYHIKGTPDVAKMVTDMVGVMKSPEFQKMMTSTTEASGTTGGLSLGSMMPSADSLQQMQNELTDLFKNVSVEFWIGKDDSLPRKVSVTAHIVPPAGQNTQGVNSIDLTMNISLQNLNQPVTVQAPESPLPYADLEKAFQDNPEQLLGPIGSLLQGLMGSLGAMEGTGETGATTGSTGTVTPSTVSQ